MTLKYSICWFALLVWRISFKKASGPDNILKDVMMASPFDYAKSIDTQEYINDISGYSAYIINKKLSLAVDTILYANEMNINYELEPKLQYDFFFYSIRPNKKRPYTKWIKNEKEDEDLGAISEYYGYNNQKAKAALAILSLSPTQITNIKKSLIKGGHNE